MKKGKILYCLMMFTVIPQMIHAGDQEAGLSVSENPLNELSANRQKHRKVRSPVIEAESEMDEDDDFFTQACDKMYRYRFELAGLAVISAINIAAVNHLTQRNLRPTYVLQAPKPEPQGGPGLGTQLAFMIGMPIVGGLAQQAFYGAACISNLCRSC